MPSLGNRKRNKEVEEKEGNKDWESDYFPSFMKQKKKKNPLQKPATALNLSALFAFYTARVQTLNKTFKIPPSKSSRPDPVSLNTFQTRAGCRRVKGGWLSDWFHKSPLIVHVGFVTRVNICTFYFYPYIAGEFPPRRLYDGDSL